MLTRSSLTIRLHPADDVVIARQQLVGGTTLIDEKVAVAGLVPPGHKVATRAIAAGAPVIGVNHRNLATLAIDMSLTARIAPSIPAGTILVGESGIKTAADVRALGAAGAHAILVGESLMKAPEPGAALAELLA